MRKTFLWEMCACHIHGQFSAGDHVITLGQSLSTPAIIENDLPSKLAPLLSRRLVWRSPEVPPSLLKFCDSEADNVLVRIY